MRIGIAKQEVLNHTVAIPVIGPKKIGHDDREIVDGGLSALRQWGKSDFLYIVVAVLVLDQYDNGHIVGSTILIQYKLNCFFLNGSSA